MVLIIKSKETKALHEIDWLVIREGKQIIWSETWPGEHIVGQDCDLLSLTDREWNVVRTALDNPEMSLRQITKMLKYPYNWIYRMALKYNLQVKAERRPKKYKPGLPRNSRGKYYET